MSLNNFEQAVNDKQEVAWLQSNDYSWDEVRVWKDDTQFYWATDGGCSCNYFGSDLEADDLKILDSLGSPAFRAAVDRAFDVTPDERADFLLTVRRAMT